jgi:hypothetical protein
VRVGEEKAKERNEGKEDREGHVTNYVKQVFNSQIDQDLKIRSGVPANVSYRENLEIERFTACFAHIIL